MSSPVCSGQSAYPHTPRGVDTFCFLGPRLPAGRAFLRATTPLSTSSCSDTLCTCPEAGERTSAAFVAPADMMQRLAGLFLRSARTFSSTSFVYDLQHVTYAQTCTSASMQCKHACRVCGAGGAGGVPCCTSCPGQRASLQRAPPAHGQTIAMFVIAF